MTCASKDLGGVLPVRIIPKPSSPNPGLWKICLPIPDARKDGICCSKVNVVQWCPEFSSFWRSSTACDHRLTYKWKQSNWVFLIPNLGMYIVPTVLIVGIIFKDSAS